jgi:HK97 family phage portal protein
MADPSKLHRAVLGPSDILAQGLTSRPERSGGDNPEDMFSLWVHRLTMINATVAATLSWKLVRITRDSAARRDLERAGVVRKLSRESKAYIRGDHDMAAPASVRKATRYRLDDAVEVEQHPIIDLMQQANPWTDGYGLMEGTYADLQLFGDAYWFRSQPDAGEAVPSELWRMMPSRITPVADRETFVRGFTYRVPSGGTQEFGPQEVVWFRRYNPGNPYRGICELDAWRSYARAAGHIAEFNSWLFERHGTPDHLVTTPKPVSESDKRAFRSRWRNLFGKLYRRKETVAFLSGAEVKIERLGQTSRELEFSESSRLVRDFLCAGFGVPKALVTPEDANRAVTKEATDQHLRLTVWPLACRVFDTLNEQLLPAFGPGYLIVPDNPIRTDAATRASERASKLSSGWSVDEIRREDGAEPLGTPEAETPMIAGGLTPLAIAVEPPMPMMPFSPAAPDDDDDDDDDGPDGPQEPEDDEDDPDGPETNGTRQRAATARHRAAGCRCCPEVEGLSGEIKQSDVLGLARMPGLDQLERMSKAAIPDDPEEIRLLARPVQAAIRAMRTILLASADRIVNPEDVLRILGDQAEGVVRQLSGEVQGGMERVVTATGQASLNGLRPGVGLAFNATNPLVVEYVLGSAGRIAQTVATTYPAATVKQLEAMIRMGTNPVQAAKQIAQTNATEEWMARRLARTEARFASAFAQEQGMIQSGVVEAKQFVLSANPCDICASVDSTFEQTNPSKRFELGKPMFQSGASFDLPPGKNGEPRTYVMDYFDDGQPGPPIHPNCRCTMRAVIIGD